MSLPSEPNAPVNKWIARMCEPLRQWCKRRQPLPDMADFAVSETPDGVRFALRPETVQALAGAGLPYRNEIIDATTATEAKVRVRLGKCGGFVSGGTAMTDPTDSPVCLVTVGASAGWFYIYCQVTMAFDTVDGYWHSVAPVAATMLSAAAVPADDATHAYVEFGTVRVASNGTGGWRVAEIGPPSATGDQWVARTGGSTDTSHTNGRIG